MTAKCRIQIVFVLALLLSIKPSTSQETVFFQKALADNRRLVVLRQEVPYIPPTEQQKAELARRFPGAKYADVQPERTGAYSLFLVSADGKPRRLLWHKKRVMEYHNSRFDTPFKIFDAVYEFDTLIILFRTSGSLQAEFVDANSPVTTNNTVQERILLREFNGSTAAIETAVIEGSLKDNTIVVSIKTARANGEGGNFRFEYQNGKWVDRTPPALRKERNSSRKLPVPPFEYQVFEKALSRTQRIVVYGRYVRTQNAIELNLGLVKETKEMTLASGVAERYVYVLITDPHSTQKTIWSQEVWDLSTKAATGEMPVNAAPVPPSAIRVLDVSYEAEKEVLIVAYRRNGVIYADVVRSDGKNGRTGLDLDNKRLLLPPALKNISTLAKIEGQIDNETLKVSLSLGDVQTSYSWENQQWKRNDP